LIADVKVLLKNSVSKHRFDINGGKIGMGNEVVSKHRFDIKGGNIVAENDFVSKHRFDTNDDDITVKNDSVFNRRFDIDQNQNFVKNESVSKHRLEGNGVNIIMENEPVFQHRLDINSDNSATENDSVSKHRFDTTGGSIVMVNDSIAENEPEDQPKLNADYSVKEDEKQERNIQNTITTRIDQNISPVKEYAIPVNDNIENDHDMTSTIIKNSNSSNTANEQSSPLCNDDQSDKETINADLTAKMEYSGNTPLDGMAAQNISIKIDNVREKVVNETEHFLTPDDSENNIASAPQTQR
jgi:hypothetical protein